MIARSVTIVCALTLSAGPLGCGSPNPNPTTGDSETQTSTTSDASSDPSASSTTASTTATAPSCDDFLDSAEEGPGVTITVRNGGEEAVYLSTPDGCSAEYYEVASASSVFPNPSCLTCEDHLSNADCGCPKPCFRPFLIMLAPGGTHELTWSGRAYRDATPPDECVASVDECGGACRVQEQAEAGAYTFRAGAYSREDACAWIGEPDCECEPDENGSCVLEGEGGPEAFADLFAEATQDYPAQTAVELVF